LSRINEDRTREDISTRDLKNLTKAAIENLEKIIEAKENVGRIIAENPGLSLSDVVKENYANVEDQLSAARELLESNKQLEGEIAATIKDEKSKAKLFANLPSSDSLEMDPEKEKKLQDAIQVNKEKAIQAKSQTTIAKRVRGIAGRQEVKQKIKREFSDFTKVPTMEEKRAQKATKKEKQKLNEVYEKGIKAELTENIMNDLAMSDSLSRINEDRTREDISTRDLKNLTKAAKEAVAQEKAKEVLNELGLSSAKPGEEKQPLTPDSLWNSIDKDPMFKGRDNLKILMNDFLGDYLKAKSLDESLTLKKFSFQQQDNLGKTAEDKAAALGRKLTGRATDADLFKEIVTNLAEEKEPLEGIKEAKKGQFIRASKLQSKNQGQSR
ncbi:MAG: hypothetical protein N4A31_01315, partial [Rickettsiales bacterium]|nr:hypothetical protein [Rickettsiales bacterium]